MKNIYLVPWFKKWTVTNLYINQHNLLSSLWVWTRVNFKYLLCKSFNVTMCEHFSYKLHGVFKWRLWIIWKLGLFEVHVNQACLTITTITHAVRSLHFSICLCVVLSESLQRGSPEHYPAGVLQLSLTVFVLVALAVHMGQTRAAGLVPKSHRSQVWCSCFSALNFIWPSSQSALSHLLQQKIWSQTEALKTFLNIFILWSLIQTSAQSHLRFYQFSLCGCTIA